MLEKSLLWGRSSEIKTPVPLTGIPGFDSQLGLQLPASAHSGRPQMVVQVLGFLPPTWETWVGFLTVSARPSPGCGGHLESESDGSSVCVSGSRCPASR